MTTIGLRAASFQLQVPRYAFGAAAYRWSRDVEKTAKKNAFADASLDLALKELVGGTTQGLSFFLLNNLIV